MKNQSGFDLSYMTATILLLFAAFALTNCASDGPKNNRIQDYVKCSSTRTCNTGN